MTRPMTFWYTKDQPIFENVDEVENSPIDVTRIPAGSDSPPCLRISHATFETLEKANWEFLRLSLPVTCQTVFIEYAQREMLECRGSAQMIGKHQGAVVFLRWLSSRISLVILLDIPSDKSVYNQTI